MTAWLGRQASREAVAPGVLGHLQAVIGRSSGAVTLDNTVAAFGLRDPREEAEFAAARAQQMLDDGIVATPSEIGVLVQRLSLKLPRLLRCHLIVLLSLPVGHLFTADLVRAGYFDHLKQAIPYVKVISH